MAYFLYILTNIWLLLFFHFNHSGKCIVISMWFKFSFRQLVLTIFLCAFFYVNILFRLFADFLIELLLLSLLLVLLSFGRFLYILDTNLLSDAWFANIFSLSVAYLCISFIGIVTEQKLLILMRSNLSIFFFMDVLLVSCLFA